MSIVMIMVVMLVVVVVMLIDDNGVDGGGGDFLIHLENQLQIWNTVIVVSAAGRGHSGSWIHEGS